MIEDSERHAIVSKWTTLTILLFYHLEIGKRRKMAQRQHMRGVQRWSWTRSFLDRGSLRDLRDRHQFEDVKDAKEEIRSCCGVGVVHRADW
jgi:hypothetical protein